MRKGMTAQENALLRRIVATWPNPLERATAYAAIARSQADVNATGGNDDCKHNDLLRHVIGTIECGRCGRIWAP